MSGRFRIIALLSLVPAVYGVSLLFSDSIRWMNHEYLIFSLPGALLNGIHLKWQDLFRGFDPLVFDVVRPRFINYVITIFNVKVRLLAYQYFIPPANFSLGLIIHLLFAPVLFFVLCRKLFANSWIALLGTCLYVSSVGFLSSVAIFAQPGKNIIHALTLALFVALATLDGPGQRRYFGEGSGRIVAFVMLMNLIAMSIDDQYAIAVVAGSVLFYPLFLPSSFSATDCSRAARALGLYFGPLAAFALFAAFAAPYVSEKLGSGRCDYLGVLFQYSADKLPKTPYWPFFADLTSAAIASSIMPTPFPPDMSAFKLSLRGWPLAFFGISLAVIAALLFKRVLFVQGPLSQRLGMPWRIALTTVVYFLLQTMLQRFHEQVTGGYYYQSLAAIFFSLLVLSLFASQDAGQEKNFSPFILPVFMVFQLLNFIDLNDRWRSAHIPLTRHLLDIRQAYPNLIVNEGGARSDEQAARMEDVWNRWRRGEKLDETLMEKWPVTDGWFLFEINALDGRIFKDAKPKCPGWFPGSGWWRPV